MCICMYNINILLWWAAQVEKVLKKLSEIFCFVFRTRQTENTFLRVYAREN